MALPGWSPGGFLMASRAKSQVMLLLEAWRIFRVSRELQKRSHEWESGLPLKAACPPVTLAGGGAEQGGEGWIAQNALHFHRGCYWKRNLSGTGDSCRWV